MKRLFKTLALLLFSCLTLAGCDDSPLLSARNPVSLSMWHVYGAQADSPMNRLVETFNNTVGKEEGVCINVTSISNSTAIHFAHVAAAQKHPGAALPPDLTVAYPKTILEVGPSGFMDWSEHFTDEQLAQYVPAFLEEGTFDGRLILFPIAKSSSALFINATIFDKFAAETGCSYDDLDTWEGMFRVARLYHKWSGGKAFFKYDDWLHYSMVNTASLGGTLFRDGKVDFSSPQFERVWKTLASAGASGDICMLDGYSTTAMMTAESVCGIESTASILYFKDTVTFPDNTKAPLRLHVLPVPHFKDGKALAIQRGTGLCMLNTSSRQKQRGAALFADWLTKAENNAPFVTTAGYLPVKNATYQNFLDSGNFKYSAPKVVSLYEAVERMHKEYEFWIPPYFDGYGDLEKKFCKTQMVLFAKYKAKCGGKAPSDEVVDAMWREFKALMERP